MAERNSSPLSNQECLRSSDVPFRSTGGLDRQDRRISIGLQIEILPLCNSIVGLLFSLRTSAILTAPRIRHCGTWPRHDFYRVVIDGADVDGLETISVMQKS